MKWKIIVFLGLLAFGTVIGVMAAQYGAKLCNDPRFFCYKVVKGQSWETIWPDQYQRDLIKRLNRVNINLYPGMVVAVPKDLSDTDPKAYSPFPLKINPTGEKLIVVSPSVLAWAAYNPDGELQFWGPMSGGKSYCPDIGKSCKTSVGSFYVYRKQGADCISHTFPIETSGGAPMPYCMFFNRGFALHGSPSLPGYHASHGCVRLLNQDAEWLNKYFIDLPGQGGKGTQVIIEPYNAPPLSTLPGAQEGS